MTTRAKYYVVDTNVPIVANAALNTDADIPLSCILACVHEIERISKKGGLVLDEGGEIVEEYRKKLSPSGQPGLGDKFLKWVFTHQYNPGKVTRVTIHKQGDTYQEFPSDPRLEKFDLSDRKFVAVAVTHPDKPPVLQAADSDWWYYKDALESAGVSVHFLCPEYIKENTKKLYEKEQRRAINTDSFKTKG